MLLRRYLIFILILFQVMVLHANDKQIGVYEALGKTLPLNLELTNEYNETKPLKAFLNNKPTILTLNYFECPGLCSPLLNSVASTIERLDLKPYIDYQVITLSFEPNDRPNDAKAKKESLLSSIKKPFPPQGWSFLTTSQENIDAITNTVGFKYEKRIKEGIVDYLHPGVIIAISPQGKITRYLNGIEFLPFDVKMALLEASDEQTRPTITKTLLYCFAYDAKAKTYVFQAEKVLGSFMFGAVLIFFIYLVKTGRKKKETDHE